MELIIWFAQVPAPKSGGTGSLLIQFLPFILIFVLFWFLIIRPQRKREREHQELLNALKKGDKVVMSSGIFGEIHSVTTQTAVIEIAPKVKVTVNRSSISGMVNSEQYASLQNQDSSSSTSDDSDHSVKMLKKKKK